MGHHRLALRGNVEKLRMESERLSVLNEKFNVLLDNLARATVRLYSNNRRLEDTEARVRLCGAALYTAALGAGRPAARKRASGR